MTVVVTGGGGPAGVAVTRALQSNGEKVVAVDADPLAVGLRLADDGATVPRADDAEYVTAIAKVAATTGADALCCTVAEEMVALHTGASELRAAGLACWLPAPETVIACIDKWKFAQAMVAAGVAVPPTARTVDEFAVPGPWIVKPRFGRGSRDVYAVDDRDELRWASRRTADAIVQTRLSGREFTVDALVDRGGALAGAVARWRLETKAGISTKGETFDSPAVTEACEGALRAVGLEGPANVQGFVAASGAVTIVEINPRFSGGLPLSLAAGADLVGEYVRGVRGERVRPERLRARAGVVMLRHFVELFEG